MLPPKTSGSGTSKPFAVSFSNTSRKPVNSPQNTRPRVSSSLRHHRHHISHDESDEEDKEPISEEVTGFDMGGAISKNAPKEKEPLVIKVESRNNWRDRPGTNRRGKNLLPQEVQAQVAGNNVAAVETETPSMAYGLSLAPVQKEGAVESGSDVAMADTAPISKPEARVPLTQDEIALQALIRESEGGETTRRSDLVIESTRTEGRYDEASSFRADVATRPDQASLDAYDAVPVEEFGAALLRGMGWKEGQAIGRGTYGNTAAPNEARVPERRPGFLGIGAKDIGGAKGAEVEIGAWGKAAMRKGSRKGGDGSGNTEGVYMPVVMKSKTTGEHLTEEEFKLRQKEASERKANGRPDERSSRSNGRDKDRRRYDDDSDPDRYRRRRHDKRRDRSRSSGAPDRRRYDDEDDVKRSSRDHRRYRDRDDSEYKSRRRSRDRSHRDSGYSRRDDDNRRIRDRDRDLDRRSDRDRDRDRHR